MGCITIKYSCLSGIHLFVVYKAESLQYELNICLLNAYLMFHLTAGIFLSWLIKMFGFFFFALLFDARDSLGQSFYAEDIILK